jgi:hypothetical protein
MGIVQQFEDIQGNTGADDMTAAIILLAEVIQSKGLTLDDGDAIGHGIYRALDKVLETSSSFCVSIESDLNVTTDKA